MHKKCRAKELKVYKLTIKCGLAINIQCSLKPFQNFSKNIFDGF